MTANPHVCLISGQTIANLIPLLQENPAKAVFLFTSRTEKEAERLKKVVGPRGIRVETIKIDPFNFNDVADRCDELLEKFNKDLTLNVTGGTKITALAAFNSFYTADARIIYLDTSRDRILELAPEEHEIPVESRVFVKDYLKCYGLEITGCDHQRIAPERKNGLEKLCELLCKNEDFQSSLNRAINKYHSNYNYANIPYEELEEKVVKAILECNAAKITPNGMLNISNSKDIFFCNGGWLEEYVFEAVAQLCIKGVKPLRNVKVEWDQAGKRPSTNEFDVMFCHRNRLHIVSCKTGDLDRITENATRGREALYELDSLADAAGGIFGKTMLCSSRPLSGYTKKRADLMGIEVISGPQLMDIKKRIRAWIER